jgi:hypothetical protein
VWIVVAEFFLSEAVGIVLDSGIYIGIANFGDSNLDGEFNSSELVAVFGDVNGDGRFDSSDLIQVYQAGEYEDAIFGNSTFEEGDWNDDGEFDSSDLVLAFKDGYYAAAARPLANGIGAIVNSIFARNSEAGRAERAQLHDGILATGGHEDVL